MALFVCAMAVVRPARAEDDDGRKRVAVLPFGGPQGARVQGAVVAGLKRQVAVVGADEFGEVLASAEGPTRQDRIAAACQELGLVAAVEGAMRRAGRIWSVEVIVRDCANGEKIVPAGRATFSMRNLGGIAAIRGSIWGRVGEAILGAGGAAGAGASRVAAAGRPAGRETQRPGARPAPTPPPPAARPAAAPRRASASADTCMFEEDEPPEGFPGYGDWVRRRNSFINRCEADRERRAQLAVQQRQEAERRAQAEARESARRAAEEQRQRREDAVRAERAAEVRRLREEENRRRAIDDARRRREEEERVAERRRRDEESRQVEDRRRREEAEAVDRRGRNDEEEERRRERPRNDDDLERDVAAYRARLERERRAALDEPDYDDRRRRYEDEPELEDPPPEEEEPTYEDGGEDRGPRGDRRRRYDEDEGAGYEEGGDEDPVYDPEREEDDPPVEPREDEGDGEPAESRRPGGRPRREPTILDIGAGIGFVNRQMTVAVEGSAQPRSYAAPGYPELSVRAEFFPGALTKNPGAMGGLGVFGVFRRHLFLQTSGIDATTNEAIDIPTGEQELAGGAVFRVPMGDGPKSPVFSIAVAYGYFQFLLDPTQMLRLDSSMQMPTMTYVNVIGEAGVAIPLDDRGLAVELGGTYRYVLDVGQAARDIFGANTKGGYAFGGRVALGGEAAFIAKGLAWSIQADALIFNTEFSGASSADGGRIGGFPSGSDRYLRGVAMLGYRFR